MAVASVLVFSPRRRHPIPLSHRPSLLCAASLCALLAYESMRPRPRIFDVKTQGHGKTSAHQEPPLQR